ncbi:uncharacterized protein LOC143235154 [Tachypleus tridentatus]|uniref:uncharacterized protein LOC143235154 n=1 Tax=Tachypleus tridentatus TaxID=6853 RepID=UPI003FCF9E57
MKGIIHDGYGPGDLVDVTCTAAPSKPPALLKWFIDDKEVQTSHQKIIPPLKKGRLFLSRLVLNFVVKPTLGWHSPTRLRCTSMIIQEYSRSVEKVFLKGVKLINLYPAKGEIHISGLKSSYELGENVDVNCSSSTFTSPPVLRWYLNGEQVMSKQLLFYPIADYKDGYKTAVLGLRFTVQENHFRKEQMRINCTATFSVIIDRRDAETLIGLGQQSSGLQLSENKKNGISGSSGLHKHLWKSIFLLSTVLWHFF